MSELNPRLILIAGPNGAGKTEFTNRVLAHEWLEGCEYINPDLIAQNQFGDWNSPSAVAKAARFSTDLRYECLEEARSLALETVFSTQEKLDFVDTAVDSGFFVRLFFIGTDNPTINASRIARRVIEGGHDVPIAKIVDRYHRSISNLAKALPLINRCYIYDNSVDEELPKLQFRTVDGSIQKVYEDDHVWANRVRETIETRQSELGR